MLLGLLALFGNIGAGIVSDADNCVRNRDIGACFNVAETASVGGGIKRAVTAIPGAIKAVQEGVGAPRIGKSLCSFVPGTLVLMADGTYKPIEDLQAGDLVLATDPETGKTEPRAVLAPLTSEGVKNLIQLTIDTDGPTGNQTSTLIATDNHPFWSPDLDTWTPAGDLKTGSLLQTSASAKVQVTATRTWAVIQRVHNLTIDEIHAYYVLAGETPILVHNSNSCGPFTSTDPHVADAANAIEQAIPGQVVGVNTNVPMSNGLLREVDIDLGNIVVQVKGGNARGLTGQMERTAASTGRTVVGYAPGMLGNAWENAARQGLPIARTIDELVAIVKELK